MALIEQPHQPSTDKKRFIVVSVLTVCASMVLVARLWYLQIAHGEEMLRSSLANVTRVVRRVPPRGVIIDARGHILATSRPRITVRVSPEQVSKDPAILKRIARLLQVSEQELMAAYTENKTSPYQPVLIATNVTLEQATRLEENRHLLPGMTVGPEPTRSYRVGEAFGHVLGYVGKCSDRDLKERADSGYLPGDVCGKVGIEGGPYDKDLRGVDGSVTYEVDALGQVHAELGTVDPVPGATLRLSLRADLQAVTYRELAPWLRRGHPAAAVAMDPRTGAILAMVSVPSYDPRDFEGGIPRSRWKYLQAHPLRPLINRTTTMASAPGSVFKVVTALAGLETRKTSVHDSGYCTGVIFLGKWPKRCHRRSGHGHVGFYEAMAKSCDVFFYRLGQRLGPETIAEYARLLGFGSRTGVDIACGESAGIVPDPAWKRRRGFGPWVGGDTVDYAIGQAMLATTPLQVCSAISAIANGGVLYRPHVVQEVTRYSRKGPEGTERVKPEVIRRLPFASANLAAVRQSMEAVVRPGGTGVAAAIPGIKVAGKTGTAQRMQRGRMVNDAWFAGYAPADDPRIAVCVYVEASGHGGEVAAPIARSIMAHYLGVALETTRAVDRTED